MSRHDKKVQKIILLCSIVCAMLTIGISSTVSSFDSFSLSQVIESQLVDNH